MCVCACVCASARTCLCINYVLMHAYVNALLCTFLDLVGEKTKQLIIPSFYNILRPDQILTAFYSQAALLSLTVHGARVNSCQRYTCTLLQPQALVSFLVSEIVVHSYNHGHLCHPLCQKYRCTGLQPQVLVSEIHVYTATPRCWYQKYTCTPPHPQILTPEIHMYTATTMDACVRNTCTLPHHRRLCQKYTCTLPQPQTLCQKYTCTLP